MAREYNGSRGPFVLVDPRSARKSIDLGDIMPADDQLNAAVKAFPSVCDNILGVELKDGVVLLALHEYGAQWEDHLNIAAYDAKSHKLLSKLQDATFRPNRIFPLSDGFVSCGAENIGLEGAIPKYTHLGARPLMGWTSLEVTTCYSVRFSQGRIEVAYDSEKTWEIQEPLWREIMGDVKTLDRLFETSQNAFAGRTVYQANLQDGSVCLSNRDDFKDETGWLCSRPR